MKYFITSNLRNILNEVLKNIFMNQYRSDSFLVSDFLKIGWVSSLRVSTALHHQPCSPHAGPQESWGNRGWAYSPPSSLPSCSSIAATATTPAALSQENNGGNLWNESSGSDS